MTNVANLADCQVLAAVLAGLAAGQSGEEGPLVPYTGPAPAASPSARRLRLVGAREPATSESVGWQIFGKMLLVFGCIGSDFCKKIYVLQHFSKSTRFSS